MMLLIITLACISCGPGPREKRIQLIRNDSIQSVDILIDGEFFTAYIYPENLEKPVLYPVKAANGNIVTRGFPLDPREGERVDHPHHIGVWFNYGDINGYDFWNNSYAIPEENKVRYGFIKHRDILGMSDGQDSAVLKVLTHWMAPAGGEEPPRLLLEETTVFTFRGNDSMRTITRSTKLTARENILFRDNKEGLFAVRVTRAFEHPTDEPQIYTDASGNPTEVKVVDTTGARGHYRSSEGIEGLEAWGKRARWVALHTEQKGGDVSLVIMDHPSNPGYPAYWHARGYGLFAANNLGQKVFSEGENELNFSLAEGESVTFRHQLLVKSGSLATDKEVDLLFENFANR